MKERGFMRWWNPRHYPAHIFDKSYVCDYEDMSEETGYSPEELEKIQSLKVEESHMIGDGEHIITRVR